MLTCPLCHSTDCCEFSRDKKRRFFQCSTCALVFVAKDDLPTSEAEKVEYDLHQNALNDPGYRTFLSRVTDPLTKLLPENARGLDFGCGPGPLLARMLDEQGYSTAIYDPIYAVDSSVLDHRYDFVTCTEVVEHFHHPASEWQRLTSLLNPQGLLAIMTKRVINQERFANWHYKNDPTHVCFYSDHTFEWLQAQFPLKTEYMAKDVVIMRYTGQN